MKNYVAAVAFAFATSSLYVNADTNTGTPNKSNKNVIAQMICIDPNTKLPIPRDAVNGCSPITKGSDSTDTEDSQNDLVRESTEGLSVERQIDGTDSVDLQERFRKFESADENPPVNGNRYGVVDPQTGELISGAAAEKAIQDQRNANAEIEFQQSVLEMMESAADISELQVETQESGASSVNLQGRFRIPLVFTTDPTNKAQVRHGLSHNH